MKAYDSNNILERSSFQLFPYFIWKPAKAALSHQVRDDRKENYEKEYRLVTYSQLLKLLL